MDIQNTVHVNSAFTYAQKKAISYRHEFITPEHLLSAFLEQSPFANAGDAGARLSGGERQRIAIARAILKNAPIVILDEATAFTDPENEDKLQRSIDKLTKGKTLIVIAHRLSTIMYADQILVLEDGQITAQGTHEQLLTHSETYLDMWKAHISAMDWSMNQEVSELC